MGEQTPREPDTMDELEALDADEATDDDQGVTDLPDPDQANPHDSSEPVPAETVDAMTDEQRAFFEDRLAELEAQLAESEAARADAEAKVEKWRPDFDVADRLFGDSDDVRRFFSERQLRDMAASELKEINRRRMRNGDERIVYSDEEWDEKIEEMAQELVADRTREVPLEGPMLQTIKMVKKSGSMVAIPYEPQINNMRGSLEDPLARYRNKGLKVASHNGAMLCGAGPCWEPARLENGKYTFGGFCSQDHMERSGQPEKSVPAMST